MRTPRSLTLPLLWSRRSSAVGAVALVNPTPIATPTVEGRAFVGEVVTATQGAWAEPVQISYQWLRNGAAITGQTAASYTITDADLGTDIACLVTAKAGQQATPLVASLPHPVQYFTLSFNYRDNSQYLGVI